MGLENPALLCLFADIFPVFPFSLIFPYNEKQTVAFVGAV